MKKDLTELVFILDKSGSMSGLESDTVGGFNSLIRKQREEKGECLVSVVLFDNISRVLYDRVGLDKVPEMKASDFAVGGCTALIDAVGGAVHHIGNVHKYARGEDVPEHTVFVIMTDGIENASREYTSDAVKAEIERRKSERGWEFLFLGANIDAVETAQNIGISRRRSVDYRADHLGTSLAFDTISEAVRCVRCAEPVDESWSKKIKEDTKKRRRTH